MPKKKRTITVSADEEIKIEAVQEEPKETKTVIEKAGDLVASLVNCGHQNMHYTAGELYCTLDKGHKGDHSAELDGKRSFWSDAAGIPVRKHK